MMNKYIFFVFILIMAGLSGCLVPQNPYSGLAPGFWRAELKLEPYVNKSLDEIDLEDTRANIKEVENGELPFTFEVKYENENKFYIEIKNGEERIRVDDIIIGRDRKTAKDTIRIEFPNKGGYIHGIFQENIIEGEWVAAYDNAITVPFAARQGQNHRFTTLRETPAMDISGKWEMNYKNPTTGLDVKSMINFKQKDNYLTGAIKSEFNGSMEGTIQANKLYLSRFDGMNMLLMESRIQSDSTLIGSLQVGRKVPITWEARRILQ